MYRKTYLEVDLSALKKNISFLRNHSSKELIAVVKADAYGAILKEVVPSFLAANVKHFAVATLEEALELRKYSPDVFIQILGPVDNEFLPLVKENKLCVVTTNAHIFDDVNLDGIMVCLKIDTGMHRIGILPSEAKEVMTKLIAKKAIIKGAFTHFAKSDNDEIFTQKQYNLFAESLKDIKDLEIISCCNSDASINFKNDNVSNFIRCGNALWGYASFASDLQPVFSLYSHVSNVKQVLKGETIGYGGRYTSDGNGYILTLPIGYADGISRNYSGGKVYVDGEIGTIVGSVCMDQLMVHCQNYHPLNTRVEFFGPHLSLKEMAVYCQTINYTILVGISSRVTRLYKENGLVIKEFTPRYNN